MPERVTVRQRSDFSTRFLAADPEGPADAPPAPVERIHELTPYGMLLAGLGTCTAILLHSYAGRRNLPLAEVELALTYSRECRRDCPECARRERAGECIGMAVRLSGDLAAEDRERLLEVARHCPVERIIREGIPVEVVPAAGERAGTAPASGGSPGRDAGPGGAP